MRPNPSSSVHKRMSAKNFIGATDRGAAVSGRPSHNPQWRLSFPHICVATLSSFLLGYHLGFVLISPVEVTSLPLRFSDFIPLLQPLESVSMDLGFARNTLQEGLVVSTCLGGAFIGCLFSGWISDGIRRRRAFQLSALPMMMGACVRVVLAFSLGAGPIPSLLLAEMFSNRIRAMHVC